MTRDALTNKFAIGLAAALVSSVSLLAIERAYAACTPATPANGDAVTCSGTTTDQNGIDGFDSNPATGVTITVLSGATVKSTSNVGEAITTTAGTINNNGTIDGNNNGVNGLDGITLTNAGAIHAATNNSIVVSGGLTLTNSGIIDGFAGILVNNATITNSGTISETKATQAGIPAAAIQAAGGSISLDNSGLVDASGAGAFGVLSDQSVTINSNTGPNGIIRADGQNGVAIFAAGTATVSNSNLIQGVSQAITGNNVVIDGNSGTISATDPTGIAVQATQSATVTNLANGLIAGPAGGISAATVTVKGNDGTIEAANIPNVTAAQGGIAIKATGAGDADITNSRIIQALETGGIAILAGGTATITNNVTGTITGDAAAINASTVNVKNNRGAITGNAIAISGETINVTSNIGTIEATAASVGGGGFAISGDKVTVTSSGVIRENGIDGRAINANSSAIATATVNNLAGGSIIADGANGTAIAGGNAVTATNAGKISAANGIGISTGGLAAVNNLTGGTITGGNRGVVARTLDVTNAGTISSGGNAIEGSGIVRNAGTISGNAAVAFNGGAGVTNQLILQTGSQLIGDAIGSAQGATNQLILEGHGTASTNFIGFNTLDVQADTAWVWNTTANFTGGATVSSGTLAVDGVLNSSAAVNAGGTLAGRGTVSGDVNVAGGGTIAPGAVTPFSALILGGNVTFNSGSVYRVSVNAAGQNDKLTSAAASLTGGTVNVLTQNGVSLGTPYTILTARTGLGGTQFAGVGKLPFLQPTLTYDANDVFLTFAGAGPNGTFGFASAAQTRNQIAVASALDAAPTTNSLVGKLLSLTIEQARAAFDALSGEIFGSVQNTQAQDASFTRSGVLGRLRQASYAEAPGELGALGFAGPELAYAADANGSVPVKAPRGGNYSAGRDLTFWAQGLGGWGHSDSDGNAASLKSRFGGFLSGADMRFGQAWRAGLVAGYTRSDLKAGARASSAGIDSVTVGLYAGGRLGAFNLRAGAAFSYDSIDASRSVIFSGFSDATKAHFHGQVGQLFGEVGYGMGLGTFAIEPFAGLAYVHLHDGSFLESGGIAALSGSSAHEDIGYSSLGLRAATFLPLGNGTVLVPRASAQWQHAFGDVTPVTALAFQSTGTAFTVAGIPIARDSALVEAGIDWRISPWTKLGAFYQGELAAHAQSHAVKGGFTLDF